MFFCVVLCIVTRATRQLIRSENNRRISATLTLCGQIDFLFKLNVDVVREKSPDTHKLKIKFVEQWTWDAYHLNEVL